MTPARIPFVLQGVTCILCGRENDVEVKSKLPKLSAHPACALNDSLLTLCYLGSELNSFCNQDAVPMDSASADVISARLMGP